MNEFSNQFALKGQVVENCNRRCISSANFRKSKNQKHDRYTAAMIVMERIQKNIFRDFDSGYRKITSDEPEFKVSCQVSVKNVELQKLIKIKIV